ncbi:DUF4153 domain-containing protein [Bacillus rubiinfantis]|uniref:DUF4153 domain-containing protein n=1 Tax=Bacillus rubiinfantis TaxID=1499680 RepID=UPI0005A7E878|nr:DUF4153 domain-containing protein [Bacillus rubiinfantis]
MIWIRNLKGKFTGLSSAVARFPLTTLFLLGTALINASLIINDQNDYTLLLTFLCGTLLSAVSQVAYERFFTKSIVRLLLTVVVSLLTAGYYLIIRTAPTLSLEMEIRTAAALFALFICFIWVPVIKSAISFNQSFMIAFKSFFHTLFFSAVIFAGLTIIITTIHTLIYPISSNTYSHLANIVFILFAPMYLLSLIPVYPGAAVQKNLAQHQKMIEYAASCPKFLRILLSYIVIPLIAIFTFILVIYIVKNIGQDFWKDNLLEPMIVSYSITGILVYILISELKNRSVDLYRKWFPKLLIPIVLFQILSSSVTLMNTGVTHSRYYVILFGIFAVISGILLSILPIRKNGVIAALLTTFSFISIIPPVDAFTISKHSQIKLLEEVLLKNEMLEHRKIIPKESISDKDKEKITEAISYLTMMNYTKQLSYLPKDFTMYDDFSQTFGFEEYKVPEKFTTDQFIYVNVKQTGPISITGHDFFVGMDLSSQDKNGNEQFTFEKAGHSYFLVKELEDHHFTIKLVNHTKQVILEYNLEEIFDKFMDYRGETVISSDEAAFMKENDFAKITVFLQSLDFQKDSANPYLSATVYVFVQIK